MYRELAKKESRNNYRDSDNRTSSNQNKKLKLAKEIAELEKLEFQRNSTLSRLIDDFLDIAQGNAKKIISQYTEIMILKSFRYQM